MEPTEAVQNAQAWADAIIAIVGIVLASLTVIVGMGYKIYTMGLEFKAVVLGVEDSRDKFVKSKIAAQAKKLGVKESLHQKVKGMTED